jgi:His-Xaa-Ser system radical SAM maturase HxsB
MPQAPPRRTGEGETARVERLSAPFAQPSAYTPSVSDGYQLLPFRFLELDGDRFVVTNFVGQHLVLPKSTLRALIRHELPADEPSFAELESRQFLMRKGGGSDVAIDLLATQYRTKTARLSDFTSLHIFVVTLRCDTACQYCQVSRVSENRTAYDMTPLAADRAVDLVFRSPSQHLKIEFQGGEPLLNFPLIRRIIERANRANEDARRNLSFVISTNLAPLTPTMLEYCRETGLVLSTSIDGPRELHLANRPRASGDSYERTVEAIHRAREALGPACVSALMTTTRRSLNAPEGIIDEYVRLGFDSIFLRPLSPFGFAVSGEARLGYSSQEWQEFYRRALLHIVALNRAGIRLREDFASIILRRLLTPQSTGFVDLQSPTGLGIAVAVYNYDGDVYMSDESRMLAEMGDHTFRLGNVLQDSYEDMFYSKKLQQLVMDTMTEAIPQCSTCAFQPVCGTDPAYHHATQGDVVGHRPTSGFCKRTMSVMKLLVTLIEDDPQAREILLGWAY